MTIEIIDISQASAVETRKLYEAIVTELYPMNGARESFLSQWQVFDIENLPVERNRPLFVAETPDHQVAGLMLGTGLEGGVGTIIWLGVAKAWRGRNVGRKLLDFTEEFYRDLGGHKVKLFCNTAAARQFYQSCGYTVEGHHVKHWWKIDCWSVGKELN